MNEKITDGPYEEYWENGQLFLKSTFKNGKLDGPFEKYDENGIVIQVGTYKNGVLDGPLKSMTRTESDSSRNLQKWSIRWTL